MLPSVYLLMESSMYLGTVELESWSLLAWVKSPVVLPNPACEADWPGALARRPATPLLQRRLARVRSNVLLLPIYVAPGG